MKSPGYPSFIHTQRNSSVTLPHSWPEYFRNSCSLPSLLTCGLKEMKIEIFNNIENTNMLEMMTYYISFLNSDNF